MGQFAEVVLDITHSGLDQMFTYRIPEDLLEDLEPGVRVLVPFGRQGRRTGIVFSVSETAQLPGEKIKPIIKIMDPKPMLGLELLDLALWMREKYYCTLSHCLKAMIPAGIQPKNEKVAESIKKIDPLEDEQAKDIALFLEESKKPVPIHELVVLFGPDTKTMLEKLRKKGFVKISIQSHEKNLEKYQTIAKLAPNGVLEKLLEQLPRTKRTQAQWRIVEYLFQHESSTLRQMKEELGLSDATIQTLRKKGILLLEKEAIKRDVFQAGAIDRTEPFQSTKEQEEALLAIDLQLQSQSAEPILIHGITGSGKTEIYLRVIEKVLEQGKQAIVLVPEISLTPQMVNRFVGRFGDQVSVTHSKLSNGERFDQWKKARDGEISIMIGPRSAVFAPFGKLGAIIIDEEHERTYQSETTPKYDAREVAEKRCSLSGAVLIYGSATPSIETYYRAKEKQVRLIKLFDRANQSVLPKVEIVDMRQELANGNRSILSRPLDTALAENLSKGMQSILFLNRRGHSPFVSCRSCGETLLCGNCNISYTYHRNTQMLHCHYCGDQIEMPELCPVCGSKHIRYFGVGTQKIESEMKKRYPDARVLRMDMDSTVGKYSLEKILNTFEKKEADILIGTQMVAKGHDFPNVTLVGVIAADLSLFSGDFYSTETTFQLLTQVAGRAGRGDVPGKVVIQTYNPAHFSISLAKEHDYETFYEREIALRREMAYPPFAHIFGILLTGEREKEVVLAAYAMRDILLKYNQKVNFTILGPAPAALSKLKSHFRWKILIKAPEEERLRKFTLYCVEKWRTKSTGSVQANLYMNPTHSL